MNKFVDGFKTFIEALKLWQDYALKTGKCDIFWFLIDCRGVDLEDYYLEHNLVDCPLGNIEENA